MNLDRLRKELAFVTGAVERKSTIPILTHVMLDHNRGVMTLTATDLELAAISGFPAPGAKLKSTVPCHPLGKILTSLNGNENVDVSANNNQVRIESGSFAATLPGMSTESYPKIPTPTGEVLTFAGDRLNSMFQFVKHAISTEESRFTLNGALLELSSSGLRVIATDGHRMALIHQPEFAGEGRRVILPTRLIRLFPGLGDGDLDMQVDDTHCWFTAKSEGGMRILMGRKLTGSYPDYERVIPKAPPKLTATVKREPLFKMVLRMKGLADKRSCVGIVKAVSTLGTSALEISVGGDTPASDKIAAAISDIGHIEIGLNLGYVEEALRVMDCEDVRLELWDSQSAMQIQGSVDGIAAVDLIMPVRLGASMSATETKN